MSRPHVKVSEVAAGDWLMPDAAMSDCMEHGKLVEVKADGDGDLYVDCAEGKHSLDGQLDEIDGVDVYVGFSFPPETAP
jgi:hypothetical protein